MSDSRAREKYLDTLITIAVAEKETKRGMSPGDRKYIKSGVWQCLWSPTGAHHWIIRDGMMWCVYCGEERGIESCQVGIKHEATS